MLYRNILNSADDRLIKHMVAEQERNEEEGTWFDGVNKYLQLLNMNKEMVREMSKSTLKKLVKKTNSRKNEQANEGL